jgi:hypothetical protein
VPAYQDALLPYVAKLPRFDTNGSTLRILQQPVELKTWLLVRSGVTPRAEADCEQDRISQAQRNINLAALYIGKEETWLVGARRHLKGQSERKADRCALGSLAQ